MVLQSRITKDFNGMDCFNNRTEYILVKQFLYAMPFSIVENINVLEMIKTWEKKSQCREVMSGMWKIVMIKKSEEKITM